MLIVGRQKQLRHGRCLQRRPCIVSLKTLLFNVRNFDLNFFDGVHVHVSQAEVEH